MSESYNSEKLGTFCPVNKNLINLAIYVIFPSLYLALTENYKQRSDSVRIAMDLENFFKRILEDIDSVVQVYRSCQSGPETLLNLAFTRCHKLLGSLNKFAYTVEEFSCEPSRSSIKLKARIHEKFRLFDPTTTDIIMTMSIAWTIFHGTIFYAWVCILACKRLKKRYLAKYDRVSSNDNPPPNFPSVMYQEKDIETSTKEAIKERNKIRNS